MPGKSVKDHKVYAALRREGNSKGKSARIANASANGTLNRGGKRKSGKAGRRKR